MLRKWNSNSIVDCGITLLRVHLPGNHVLSVLLLSFGIGARAHSHSCGCWTRPVHLNDRMVCSNLLKQR